MNYDSDFMMKQEFYIFEFLFLKVVFVVVNLDDIKQEDLEIRLNGIFFYSDIVQLKVVLVMVEEFESDFNNWNLCLFIVSVKQLWELFGYFFIWEYL